MVAPATDIQNPPQPPRKRRKAIDITDVEAICKLITKSRLTESEACQHLGIKVDTFFKWKSLNKNTSRYTDVLMRVKAAKIASYTESIENVGFTKDWRATAWLLERTEPDRFSDRKVDVTVNLPALPDPMRQKALQAAYGSITVECEPVKPRAIPEQIPTSSVEIKSDTPSDCGL